MSDQPPAALPPPKAGREKPTSPKSHRRLTPALRLVRDASPYLLALAVFVVTAEFTLNQAAAHYADELFTLALVLIRTNTPGPPSPPAT